MSRPKKEPLPKVCFVCPARLTMNNRWWAKLPDTEQLVAICGTCWSRGQTAVGLALPRHKRRKVAR